MLVRAAPEAEIRTPFGATCIHTQHVAPVNHESSTSA